MDDPPAITVLTLNCWGLKYISALREERLAEIGRRLAELAADPSYSSSFISSLSSSSLSSSFSSSSATPPLSIVALQECWCRADFEVVHALTRDVLPHAKFFRSGVWGAGLAVLSRWPITQAGMHAYALNGRPTAFWRGDWFVGKGIASATVRVSPRLAVEVLITHTHAPYEHDRPDDSYLVHQLAQTWEMGKRATAAAERGGVYTCRKEAVGAAGAAGGEEEEGEGGGGGPGEIATDGPPARLVLAMGDFNMLPQSLPYQMLQLGARAEASSSSSTTTTTTNTGTGSDGLQLYDAWRMLHPQSSLGPMNHPAEQARQMQLRKAAGTAAAAAAAASPAIAPTAGFNLVENGATSDNVLNTWRWPKDKQRRLLRKFREMTSSGQDAVAVAAPSPSLAATVHGKEFAVAPDTPDPHGKRLDYIFYVSSSSSSSSSSSRHTRLRRRRCCWTAKTARVAMVEPHPTLGCSVSDHFAVQATLALQPVDVVDVVDADDGVGADIGAEPYAEPHADVNADISTYTRVLAEIDRYIARERRQQLWRSVHFFCAVIVAVACHIAVWFVPRLFIAFLFMLLSSLGLVAGVIDGLIALLFFSSEIRNLEEFRWQISNARAARAARAAIATIADNPTTALDSKKV